MKRHFPGLHADAARTNEFLEGIFLVRVDRAYYRWHPQKPFFILSFTGAGAKDLSLPQDYAGQLYCTQKSPLENQDWFLRDFGCDPDLARSRRGGREIPPRSHGHSTAPPASPSPVKCFSTSKRLHPPANGNSSPRMLAKVLGGGKALMTYSYAD